MRALGAESPDAAPGRSTWLERWQREGTLQERLIEWTARSRSHYSAAIDLRTLIHSLRGSVAARNYSLLKRGDYQRGRDAFAQALSRARACVQDGSIH